MTLLAKNLQRHRRQSGMSYKQLERRVIEILGSECAPTDEQLRAYHDDSLRPRRVNWVYLAAIAEAYGTTVADLAPDMRDDVERVRDLFVRRSSASGSRTGSFLMLLHDAISIAA